MWVASPNTPHHVAHAFGKARLKQRLAQEVECAQRLAHLIEKRGARRCVVRRDVPQPFAREWCAPPAKPDGCAEPEDAHHKSTLAHKRLRNDARASPLFRASLGAIMPIRITSLTLGE